MAEVRILLDTSVWVYLLRPGAPEPLAIQVSGLVRSGRAVTAGPVRLELLRGARTPAASRLIRERFAPLADLPVTPATWDQAGDLGFKLARRGMTVSSVDLVIAATAIEHGCALLHLDRDFERVRAVAPLRVEPPAWTPSSP